jgi:hypothetical protein
MDGVIYHDRAYTGTVSLKSKPTQALLPKYHNTKTFHSKKNLKSNQILFYIFPF